MRWICLVAGLLLTSTLSVARYQPPVFSCQENLLLLHVELDSLVQQVLLGSFHTLGGEVLVGGQLDEGQAGCLAWHSHQGFGRWLLDYLCQDEGCTTGYLQTYHAHWSFFFGEEAPERGGLVMNSSLWLSISFSGAVTIPCTFRSSLRTAFFSSSMAT